MKEKLKKRLAAIFAKLKLTEKASASEMTQEDWNAVFDSYNREFGTDLHADIQTAEQERLQELESQQSQILQILNNSEAEGNITQSEAARSNDNSSADPVATSTIIEGIQELKKSNLHLTAQISQMASTATPDQPLETLNAEIEVNGPGTNKTHFLGIENDMFALSHRWNRVAVNPAYASLNPVDEEEDGTKFRATAVKFGRSLANRYAYLKNNNRLDAKKLAAGEFGFDTSKLPDAGLGDQYMIRRQDALIARILEIRNVTEFFPVRYGIQDREMITNAYFTEVTQAYQKGEIWKGDMKLEPEFGYVDDAMIKVLFGTMKEIERQYIGYLNTDGSDPIKWSMIEFALLNIYKKMQFEQNERRIMGIYVKPESGVAGSYLNASTGIIYTLIRYFHENKILLHDSDAYQDYDNVTMLEAVQQFVEDIQSSLPQNQQLKDKFLYLNENHKSWWIKNIRRVYGKDSDFTGPNGYLNIVPDTEIHIKWLPNMGQLKLMFMQTPGNLMFLEFIAGEMFNVKIKEDMELVKAWSTWKEGTGASFVGPTFKNWEDLVANNYELQQIFMNKPCKEVPSDATTVTTGLKEPFWFVTSENTQTTAITDIANAHAGIAYIIECGSLTNPSTIAKADKFDSITAAWTPTKVGDYVMVILNSQNKFMELERCVGGIRTVNKLLQPNVPGAR